jgi:hypothetical protein
VARVEQQPTAARGGGAPVRGEQPAAAGGCDANCVRRAARRPVSAGGASTLGAAHGGRCS